MAEEATERVEAGTDAPSSGTQPGTEPQPGSTGEHPRSRLIAQIREGGDSAERLFKETQGRRDQAEARLAKIEAKLGRSGLSDLVEEHGGDAVMGAVKAYQALYGDPEYRSVIDAYLQTGQVPKSGKGSPKAAAQVDDVTDDDEYVDPIERKVRLLEDQNRSLAMSTAQSAVQSHLKRFFEEFPVEDDSRDRVIRALEVQLRNWGNDERGLKGLQEITQPSGYRTARALAIDCLTDDDLESAMETRRLRKNGRASRRATDVPSGRATTGREPPADLKTAMDALAYIREHPEELDAAGY